MTVTGPAVPMVEGVVSVLDTGGAQYAVSDSGTLAYSAGPSVGGGIPIYWLDRNGRTAPMRATPANWFNIRFAPDGQRLALQIAGQQAEDIWIYEWGRDHASKLTSDPASDTHPVWHPGGQRITFSSTRSDKSTANLYWQRADGSGNIQRLTDSKNTQRPAAWHRDGRLLAFEELNPVSKRDIMVLRMEGSEASGWTPGKITPLMTDAFDESAPQFSPDGRWLAYVSNVTGRDEVHVASFDGSRVGQRISIGPGSSPTWSPTAQELYYAVSAASSGIQIWVSPYVVEGDTFRAEKSRLVSESTFEGRGPTRMFDISPDGTRLAVGVVERQSANTRTVTLFFNFFEELRRKSR